MKRFIKQRNRNGIVDQCNYKIRFGVGKIGFSYFDSDNFEKIDGGKK